MGESVGPDDEEKEPDYRFTLANERTMLAWIRTALGLLAGAVAIEQVVPHFSVPWARTTISLGCVLLSIFVASRAYLRWRAVDRAMRRGAPLPRNTTVTVLTSAIALIALLVGVLLIFG